MRVKKQKRHRKAVRFYSACFGFREPYKVLCDGTFVHHLLLHGLVPADNALQRLLGARVLLFSSRCVVAELQALGESHSEALNAARQLVIARCDHEKRVSATACIESIIGESNPEHFFVATQDADLRRMFQKIAGVPVIYGLKNSLFIDQPSAHQREFVKSTEERRMHMNEPEYYKLHKKELKDELTLAKLNDDSANETSGSEHMRKTIAGGHALGVADKTKFKRKKAKGPNPLSCLKKKMKEASSNAINQDEKADSNSKRTRIRKRNRKGTFQDQQAKGT
ncbi:U3 small nucleolar RNA-associated protein 23 [Dioscorea alata]|uniref:U3 small nucleolar RNA-associated protein 23 n=1 Tax=Dioscorea alata TaxID=55571 RepID=A0ACB7WU46_DIOAL|nr:U3 small nucleolar RNA-associated protein 23 [Dioscorea alata]